MDKAQNDKIVRMTTAPVKQLIVKLAIPTMISMLVTTLYNLVDTYFVGQLGEKSATSAVTIAYALMNIIQAVGFFFGQGSGNYISRAMGGKEIEKSRKMAATGFFGAFIAGGLILLSGMIFLDPLARFCGAEEAVELSYAKDYMTVILIGAPIMCSSLVLNNQLRFQGNATFAMIGLSSGAVINFLLDAILVPKYKVLGAAIATVICQCISFTLLFVFSRFFSDNLKYTVKDVSFRFFYIKEICRGGFPSLCRQGIASFMNISLMNCCIIVSHGTEEAEMLKAAFGIVSKLMMFISSMMIGFGQGFQPVCGFNYGAEKYKRVREAFWFCVCVTFAFLLLMSILFFFIGPDILSFMQASGSGESINGVVEKAIPILKRQLVSLPVMSFVVMSNMMLQTTGNVFGASVLAMSRQGLTLIPAMFALSYILGETGLIWAQPAADILSLVISVPFVIILFKKMRKKENAYGTDHILGEEY